MNTRLYQLLLVVTIGMLHVSGSPIQDAFVYPNQDDVSQLASGQNAFARDLYLALANKTEGNLLFSPFSIGAAFGMLHMGSSGNTEAQMQSVLHFPTDKNSIKRSFRDIISDFNVDNGNYTLKTSNRAYIHNNFSIQDEFTDAITNDFLSTTEGVDFGNSESVRQQINNVVEQDTNSKIKNLIPPGAITALTRVVLVNAIYFKGMWEHVFDSQHTELRNFWIDQDTSVQVPMMYTSNEFYFDHNNYLDASILKMNYQGGRFALISVLPRTKNGLGEVENKLSSVTIEILEGSLRSMTVDVIFPKFKLEVETKIKDRLKEMGMTDAFSDEAADLSGITGDRDLFVSDAFHKAFLEINEEGSEAAAATASLINYLSMPESFIADHPFLFFIKDTRSNQILFAGRYKTPN